MPQRPDLQRRHHERRLQTRGRLLEGARALLEDVPWSELSVDRISDRAGLTRTAFYKHFADRQTLLLALLGEVDEQFEAAVSPWLNDLDADPTTSLRHALLELVQIYRDHGRLLRALADEATQDRGFGTLYADVGTRLSDRIAVRIARDLTAGRSVVADPHEVATALVWLNERHLLLRFGRAPLGDPHRVADGLAEIWLRTLYGREGPVPTRS